jgi:hypothetical protein
LTLLAGWRLGAPLKHATTLMPAQKLRRWPLTDATVIRLKRIYNF